MIPDFLKDEFYKYFTQLESLEGYVEKRVLESKEKTVCLCAKISETVSHYLRGRVPTAYDMMKEALSCVNDILVRKTKQRHTMPMEIGFKARIAKKGESPRWTREDMFHIPFEKRHLVQDNRYSIHGIPSVYLGRSIYDCYLELGKPDFDDLWISYFCFTQDNKNPSRSKQLELVDLTYSYSYRLVVHQR